MSWQDSLIKIANHEVDTLQKRLAEVVGRREGAQMRVLMLDAQAQAEIAHAAAHPDLAFSRAAYMAGVKQRRAMIEAEISGIAQEEAGARDALAQAFESQKKFEHVAEVARLARVKEAARRETAELDEMGRRAGAR
jgi:flagellar FliJ protein